jgi:Family of unknown function (DUF6131)
VRTRPEDYRPKGVLDPPLRVFDRVSVGQPVPADRVFHGAVSAPLERHNHDHFRHRPLIVLGLILPSLIPTFAFAHILLVIGVILLVVGVILAILGATGRAVGGRRHYY